MLGASQPDACSIFVYGLGYDRVEATLKEVYRLVLGARDDVGLQVSEMYVPWGVKGTKDEMFERGVVAVSYSKHDVSPPGFSLSYMPPRNGSSCNGAVVARKMASCGHHSEPAPPLTKPTNAVRTKVSTNGLIHTLTFTASLAFTSSSTAQDTDWATQTIEAFKLVDQRATVLRIGSRGARQSEAKTGQASGHSAPLGKPFLSA